MTEHAPTSYDRVRYPSLAHPQTHPDHLAVLARFFGLRAAPADRCRVLELGCGDGANLMAMAVEYPESHFAGIDLAGEPVAFGLAAARQMGLANLALEQGSVADIAREKGQFDYIIAHGLYSWVPAPVREAVLRVCRENLAPTGVAYVSYNAYPGSLLRNMVREMTLFHTRDTAGPGEKTNRARELVRWLIEAQNKPSLYQWFLKAELEDGLKRSGEQFYHDELSEVHAPFYFHEFIEQARRHRLQFLAEAAIHELPDPLKNRPALADLLRAWAPGRVEREQYHDFASCRRFRATLLCHQEQTLPNEPDPGALREMHLALASRAVARPTAISRAEAESIRCKNGVKWEVSLPLAKAALDILADLWPRSIAFGDLFAQAGSRLGNPVIVEAPMTLAQALFDAAVLEVIDLFDVPPRFCLEPGDRPLASPVARWQNRSSSCVSSLRHRYLELHDEGMRHLLSLLDGQHGQADLLAAMERYRRGLPSENWPQELHPGDGGATGPGQSEWLEKALEKLARYGLLLR